MYFWNKAKNIVEEVSTDFFSMHLRDGNYSIWGVNVAGGQVRWDRSIQGTRIHDHCTLACSQCGETVAIDPKLFHLAGYYVCSGCEAVIAERETNPDNYCNLHEVFFRGDYNDFEQECEHCPECEAEDAYEDWTASGEGQYSLGSSACYCRY